MADERNPMYKLGRRISETRKRMKELEAKNVSVPLATTTAQQMGRPGGGSSSWESNIPEFNYADEGQGWFNRSLGKPKGVTDTGAVPPYEDFKNQYWKAAGAPEVLFMRPIDIPANQQQEFIKASIEWEPKAEAA